MTEGEFAPFIEGLIRAEEHNRKLLKPCPFCGGEAKIGIGMGEYWVMCTNCEASSGMSTVNGAIELWNRRVEE